MKSPIDAAYRGCLHIKCPSCGGGPYRSADEPGWCLNMYNGLPVRIPHPQRTKAAFRLWQESKNRPE